MSKILQNLVKVYRVILCFRVVIVNDWFAQMSIKARPLAAFTWLANRSLLASAHPAASY